MNAYVAEFIGTALLLTLGAGVVANVVLARTKGHQGGWIVIAAGWGMAVFVAVACVGQFSGGHINPAVTIAAAVAGKLSWSLVPGYLVAQLLGAMTGALLAYLAYQPHFAATDDPAPKLGVFCTGPEIRSELWNLATEVIGTWVLLMAVFFFADPDMDGVTGKIGLGSLGAVPSGLVVFAIGLSLGGPTGYAINPARDLGPRLFHAIWPIPGKGGSDWGYAWVPIVGPIAGGLLAAGTYAWLANSASP